MPRDARQMDPATLLCERCGYVVEGLDERGACPECGKPIAESVPERRTGVPIEPDADGKVNWWRAAWAVLWRPGETFERVRIEIERPWHFGFRAVFWASLAFGIAAAVSLAYEFDRQYPHNYPLLNPLVVVVLVIVSPVITTSIGALIYIEMLGLKTISAVHRYRVSRPARYTIVGYASVGWLAGMIVPICVTLIPVAMSIATRSEVPVGQRRPPLPGWLGVWQNLAIFIALASFIVPLFLFELLCYIGIRRCKFANQPRIRSAEPGAGGSTSVPPVSE